MRAKVASLEALKGQRADLGLHRTWEGNYLVSTRVGGAQSFICLESVSCVYSKGRVSVKRRRPNGLNCDINVNLVSAEARQPRHGFIVRANYQ